MKAARRIALVVLLALARIATARAQEESAAPPEAEEETAWEFNASVYGYFPPADTNYGQPTVMADHGGLHLEARYNYEGIDTGSVWVGWNLGVGDELRLDATLMAGGIFGDTTGVAPGYELTITWKTLELYSEGEYVFDTDDSTGDFFYNWAQIGWSPWDWLQVGFAAQRTRAYETGLDVQRGPFIGFTWKNVTLTVFAFNGDEQPPTWVASLSVAF